MTIPFALGLFNYSGPLAGAREFQEFHEFAISMLEERGVQATYFASDGKGHSSNLAKLGNAAHRRLLASGFNELTLLSVVAVPKGSDAPAYDLTASVDFYSSHELGTEFALFSKDARFPLEPQSFRELLVGLIALYDWDFGYVTQPPFERSPQAYIRRAHPDLALAIERLPEPDLRKWFEIVVMFESSRLYRKRCIERVMPFRPLIVGDSPWRAALRRHAGCFRLLPPLDYYDDLPGFYPLSAINLNITSTQMKGAANQRVFDVPAAGAFLLTDHGRQIEGLFEPEREIVFFKDADELPDLVRFYLGHADARKRITTAARARVLAEHTYDRRLLTLFEIMKRTYA